MTDMLLERLEAAVATRDLLTHPYYQSWSMGTLTIGDLQAYAAQYRHQVEALPKLLRAARGQAPDVLAVHAVQRNLEEEEGRAAPEGGLAEPHAELWDRFAQGIGGGQADATPATRAAAESLASLVREGPIEALAALWAYEAQTARVSATKRAGLIERYGVRDQRALGFFAVHEKLDVHHAADLLACLRRACRSEADVDRACAAALRSAEAQWAFLDGVEASRLSASSRPALPAAGT